jgi:hypothetical protein
VKISDVEHCMNLYVVCTVTDTNIKFNYGVMISVVEHCMNL